jgi:Bacterial PH domain
MEYEAKELILRELDAGERLLWAGRPRRGICFRGGEIYVIPFSLIWASFWIFWETMAFRENSPLFFRFWGILFILVGAYMVAGRFVWDARRRAKTFYGVTDRHILIVYGVDSKKTTTLALKSLPGLTLDERYNGDGDVVFDTKDANHVATGGIVGRGQTVPVMFELIPQAREVYNIIRKAQRAI